MPKDQTVQVNSQAITDFVRMVRERFSSHTLSADVMAGPEVRQKVGQDGILTYLDWIIPMTYVYFGLGGPEDIGFYCSRLREEYQNKTILPILRGWLCRTNKKCSIDETTKQFKDSVRAGIAIVKSLDGTGYGIFTYESLLKDTGSYRLRDIKKRIQY